MLAINILDLLYISRSMNDLNAQVLSKIAAATFSCGTSLENFTSKLVFKDDDVGFSIDIGARDLTEGEEVRDRLKHAIAEINGIGKVTIILTSAKEVTNDQAKGDVRQAKPKIKHYIDNVRNIILVAAGKGGVGKSTIAVAIAEHLQKLGKNVGIADADIYGPSIPQMFGISGMPEIANNKMIPHIARSIQINSIGFLTKGEAIAWRGPMASKAIYQLLSVTAWDNLDYLIIDMPPGTGDIHLSILENYHVTGAVIVTTPQKISQIDVQKAIELYKKFNLHIYGIIENMSYLVDAATGNHLKIFTGESGKHLSEKYDIPLIASIPITLELPANCDTGKGLADLIDITLDRILQH